MERESERQGARNGVPACSDALWAFVRQCAIADAEYIGRICLALCGNTQVKFSRVEELQYLTIANQMADREERSRKSKERNRARVARCRRAKVSAPVVADADPVEQKKSYAPATGGIVMANSVEPVEQKMISARAPSKMEVVMACRQFGYPDDYAEQWYADMSEQNNNWCYVSGGKTIEVTKRNYRYVLRSFWRQRQKNSGEDGNKSDAQPGPRESWQEGFADPMFAGDAD